LDDKTHYFLYFLFSFVFLMDTIFFPKNPPEMLRAMTKKRSADLISRTSGIAAST